MAGHDSDGAGSSGREPVEEGPTLNRQLTLDDILDLRAYERERDALRQQVIALKRRRRVAVGPVVTLLFENRETIRFQIQEMARAEQMTTDAAVEAELRAYNPLIPEPGHLSATLFVELTDEAQLRHWLPRLVGIESAVELRTADGTPLACRPETEHESQLTRDDVTAAVHYVTWSCTPDEVAALAQGEVTLAVVHPEYRYEAALPADTLAELLDDLRG